MAAKAIEKAFVGHNRKRRGLFAMKGAAAPIPISFAFQRNVALHSLQKVGLSSNLLYKFIHILSVHKNPLT